MKAKIIKNRWLLLLFGSIFVFFSGFYVSAQSTYSIAIADSFHFLDSLAPIIRYAVQVADQFTFSETAKILPVIIMPFASSLPFSEVVTVLPRIVVPFSDSFHFVESLNLILPFVKALSDKFSYGDSINVILGGLPLGVTDVFHFSEGIAISVGQANSNPFVQTTTPSGALFINTSSTLGFLATVIGIPMVILLGIFVVAWKEGIVWMFVLLPLALTTMGAFAWLGIWPSYLVVMLIMLAAGGLTLIFMQLVFGMTGMGNSGGNSES